MHLVAIARAAGIILNWDDISELSAAVPLLAKVYPNGQADVNHFHAAGGTSCMFRQLLDGGFMHADAKTSWGTDLVTLPRSQAFLTTNKVVWQQSPQLPLDTEVLTTVDKPFSDEGGLRLLSGNLGRGVIKVSAVAALNNQIVEAPAVVIEAQDDLEPLFKSGSAGSRLCCSGALSGPQGAGYA